MIEWLQILYGNCHLKIASGGGWYLLFALDEVLPKVGLLILTFGGGARFWVSSDGIPVYVMGVTLSLENVQAFRVWLQFSTVMRCVDCARL